MCTSTVTISFRVMSISSRNGSFVMQLCPVRTPHGNVRLQMYLSDEIENWDMSAGFRLAWHFPDFMSGQIRSYHLRGLRLHSDTWQIVNMLLRGIISWLYIESFFFSMLTYIICLSLKKEVISFIISTPMHPNIMIHVWHLMKDHFRGSPLSFAWRAATNVNSPCILVNIPISSRIISIMTKYRPCSYVTLIVHVKV